MPWWRARQQSNKEAASDSLTACASIFDAAVDLMTTLPRLDRLNSSINSDEAGHESLNVDDDSVQIDHQ